ncbi:MAG: uroporphyrinogen decarboxylase family protein [Acidobacteriota bacterium]|nr:uroporphyrinogen decarboxylase family protein [Acidobacteriota bacterium]
MNSLERVRTVMAGGIPDRVPVCLHNFMLATREAGVRMEDYRVNPEAIARTHLHALEKYGHDCIVVDTDTTMLAEALGARSECAPNEPGRIVEPAIHSLDEVDRLKVINPETDGRVPALLESVRLLSKQVGSEIAIRGNADQAAFGLACLVRGIEDFLMELVEQPDNPRIAQLMEVCYQSHLAVHRALAKAGAHLTSLGDSLAGPDVTSPRMFERFARPYEARLVNDLNADGIFVVIHICGDTSKILDQLAEYGPCGFDLDYKTDAVKAKLTAGKGHVLCGNLDPSSVIAQGTVEQVREATRKLISVWKPEGRFMLNSGCAIPPTTPPENIRALVSAAHEFGGY